MFLFKKISLSSKRIPRSIVTHLRKTKSREIRLISKRDCLRGGYQVNSPQNLWHVEMRRKFYLTWLITFSKTHLWWMATFARCSALTTSYSVVGSWWTRTRWWRSSQSMRIWLPPWAPFSMWTSGWTRRYPAYSKALKSTPSKLKPRRSGSFSPMKRRRLQWTRILVVAGKVLLRLQTTWRCLIARTFLRGWFLKVLAVPPGVIIKHLG